MCCITFFFEIDNDFDSDYENNSLSINEAEDNLNQLKDESY